MNKRNPIFLGLIILVLAVWIQLTAFPPVVNLIERLEHLAYDLQLHTLLLTHKQITASSVAIVDIDDKSLYEIGRWPWPRSKVAILVQKIQEAGAVVIAFDILFTEKEENIVDLISKEIQKQNLTNINPLLEKIKPAFDYDIQFAESLKKTDSVLGMTFIPKAVTVGTLPTPLLNLETLGKKQIGLISAPGYMADIPILVAAAKNEGFINVFPDSDGIIRRVPLIMQYQENIYPSLALEAVRLFLLSKVNLITAPYGDTVRLEGIQVGNHVIPTDDDSKVIVPFIGKSYTLPFYSATDVINKKIPENALQGKIVFIGTSATGLGDLHATAVENVFPGVEIHATIAEGILQDNFSYTPSWGLGAEITITLCLGLLLVFSFPFLGPRTLGLLIIIIPAGLIFINNEIWQRTGLLISILIPLVLPIALGILNILYGYLFETLRRENLKQMFGQYVPSKHIDEMLKTPGKNYALHGEDREMTVLFADIRNFTTISEPMSASELKDLLNEFFTPMTEIIFKYRGTIDKYVGDMIMAFWGAPLKDKKHAQRALLAALEMQTAVTNLQTIFKQRNWPSIHIGIGLNTGIMTVGDMGSKFRRNYTVLGDTVNLASRIEGLTKYYGVKIITTEMTKKNQTLFVFREIDRVRVKGKNSAVTLFEVISLRKTISEKLSKEIELSNHALEYYFQKEWQKAQELFSRLHKENPDVKLYSLYLSRIETFLKEPPPANWDGVYSHTTK